MKATRFTLQSLCTISRCVSLCFLCSCACNCVFECVGVVTIVKGGGQHTSPCTHCAQSAGVFLCVLCVLVFVIVCLCVCGWSLLLREEGNKLHLAIVVRNQQVCFSVFLCVYVPVIIMCFGVWEWSLMVSHFTLQSLCAISRCVSLCSLCSCVCYCVFVRVRVITIVKL